MRTLEDLVPKLIEKTKTGSVKWRQTELPSKFDATVGRQEIVVWEWTDEDDETKGISIGIRSAGSPGLADVIYYNSFSQNYQKLEDLHNSARRSALNVEKMVDELDAALDDTD